MIASCHNHRKVRLSFSPPFTLLDWSIVKFAVVFILLLAAVLKTHQLVTVPTIGEGILHKRWFHICLVEFEFAFCVWLLLGLFPRWARWVTVLLFTLFGGVSFYKGLSGETSCGCFGAAKVNPWFTTILDFVLVFLSVFAGKVTKKTLIHRFSVRGRAAALICLWGLSSFLLIYFVLLPFLGLSPSEGGTFDFGVVRQQEELTHTFELTNISNRPITISAIGTSCGCMIPENEEELVGRAVSSGQTVPLTVRLKTGGSRGEISKAVLIRYRGSVAAHRIGTLQLNLDATVKEDYTLDPPSVDMGVLDIPGEEPAAATVVLRKTVSEPLKILSFKPSIGEITADVVSETQDSITIKVEVDRLRQAQSGRRDGYVVVKTDSKSSPSAVLPVVWLASKRVELLPDTLVISSETKGPVSESVQIRTTMPSVIEEVISTDDRVECSVEEHDPKTEHTLRINIPETDIFLSGTIRIRVSFKDGSLDRGALSSCQAQLEFYRFVEDSVAGGESQ